MLNKQIEILSKGDFKLVALELEISKYLKDCFLYNLTKGEYDEGDVTKAHIWLQNTFTQEFNDITNKTEI